MNNVQFANEIRIGEESGLRIMEITDKGEYAILNRKLYDKMWLSYVSDQDSTPLILPQTEVIDPAQERIPEMECYFKSNKS